MTEHVNEVLARMLVDRWHVESGRSRLASEIENNRSGRVGIAVIDLDASAVVRARGLEAKMDVVKQLRLRLDGLSKGRPDVVTVDSGSRDEVAIAIVGSEAHDIFDLGYRAWATVRDAPFDVDGQAHEMTASVGSRLLSGRPSAATVLAAAWASLALAKCQRDTVVHIGGPDRTVEVACPASTATVLSKNGVAIADAFLLGLWLLDELKGPMTYWGAQLEKGTSPFLERASLPEAVPTAAIALFMWMLRIATAPSARGERNILDRVDGFVSALAPGKTKECKAGVDVGEWIDNLSAVADGLFEPRSRTMVHVPWNRYVSSTLDSLAEKTGMGWSSLTCGAFNLAAVHSHAWRSYGEAL